MKSKVGNIVCTILSADEMGCCEHLCRLCSAQFYLYLSIIAYNLAQQKWYHLMELVRNMEFRVLLQNYRLKICILTRFQVICTLMKFEACACASCLRVGKFTACPAVCICLWEPRLLKGLLLMSKMTCRTWLRKLGRQPQVFYIMHRNPEECTIFPFFFPSLFPNTAVLGKQQQHSSPFFFTTHTEHCTSDTSGHQMCDSPPHTHPKKFSMIPARCPTI